MQFIITAYDFEDDDAINRRLANRQAHLDDIKKMVMQGMFLSGGAILNSDGKMIGSSVHVEFEDRSAVDAWIVQDPYTTGKVWDRVTISEGALFPVRKHLKFSAT